MGLFKKFAGSQMEVGVVKGETPGHLGVWALWDPKRDPTEVYRVVVKPIAPERRVQIDNFSYTFGPAHENSFVQSIETPWELKQFLVGWDRAREGGVTFDFWLANGGVVSKTYTLKEVTDALRGKGCEAPERCERIPGYLTKDTLHIAALKHTELKAHSEKIKKELEEKKRKEEEERKKKEAEAAAKAEAAKAAAAKAVSGAATPAAGGADRSKPTINPCKAAIFYGSSTGNTKSVAETIQSELGIDVVKNVSECHPVDFTVPEVLILGIPTWHIGELQDDWAAILPEVSALNYKGKKVAIFGLGDQKGYADTYVDAMMELWEAFGKTGATLHGLWPTDGYDFKKSKAIKDGKFLGVVIDVENQDNLSDKRIKSWCGQIRGELGL
jgi:flavodoxin I